MNCCCYQCVRKRAILCVSACPGVLQLQRVLFAPDIHRATPRWSDCDWGNERGSGIYTPQHPSWHSSLTGTSHQALSTLQHYPIQELWWGSVQRRQMSYPFLALALAKFNACYRSSPQWHSARAGNSCPDCRLNLGSKVRLPTNSFQLLTVLPKQETGDRRQGTETGDRRRETGDRETGDRR